MKSSITSMLMLATFTSFCQIPNAGFENWTVIDDLEILDGWSTNNAPCCISASKTEDSIEGNFALRIINNGPSFEGTAPGTASTTFVPTSAADGISFFAKCDSVWGSGKGIVRVSGLVDGTFEELGLWQTDTIITEYTQFTIATGPLEDYESIRIHIEAFAENDPLGNATGYVSLYIDDMRDELSTGFHVPEKGNFIIVSPNPSSGIFTLHSLTPITSLQVLDETGRIVKLVKPSSTHLNVTIDMGGFSAGVYFIQAIDRSGIGSTIKIQLL